jgi:hypothetical protein
MNYNDALKLATEKHKGQFRKVSGEDYITHPISVANKFEDENRKIVAVLHDTIEDTDLTLGDLRRFGLDRKLIFYIDILTKKDNQTYLDYILHIRGYKIPREIKIEDLKHNLSDNPLTKCSKDKYIMALYILGVK